MSSEELKAIYRHVVEDGWNKGNLAVIEELYAPNFVYHHPVLPQAKDLEGFKKFFTAVHTSYPDVHFSADDLIAEGDKVVDRWTFTGTSRGESPTVGTPPTGKHVTMTGITIRRITGGKVVEEWVEGDYLGLQKQLQG
jgi:steroid delta-isomerase-like uncharacterized protein